LTIISTTLGLLATLFVLLFWNALITLANLYIIDRRQTRDAIRHNFPVIGRLRALFIRLGDYFRPYFFMADREELPFNRAERNWVYGASTELDNTRAFGSTKNLHFEGTPIFINCAFPTMEKDASATQPLEIGPYCREPYHAPSIFNISGMSYGALSKPAIQALSGGAKLAGCWLNTGEGGLSQWHLESGCDIVFQIGTAKYGVRSEDSLLDDDMLREVAAAHPEVKMIELKLSQGAKPGKGGILPGIKVTPEIAAIRKIEPGKDSISPNRHPEVDSIPSLLDMIARIREVTGKPAGFKAVISEEQSIEDLCAEINRRGPESAPDFITVDGGDGGTGAAPMPLMDNVGLPLREALPMLADTLIRHNLKGRIRIIASGKLITPAEVAWALCAGADFVNNARGFMFALGCIQALRCNKNTCPTGVATHNKHLQAALNPIDKARRVARYCKNIVHEVEIIAHSCGVTEPRRLRRHHVRIVEAEQRSVQMDKIYPYPEKPRETKAG